MLKSIIAVGLVIFAAAAARAAEGPAVALTTDRAAIGTTLLVTLDIGQASAPISGLTLHYAGQQAVAFRPPGAAADQLAALIAIPYSADPGAAELTIAWHQGGALQRRTMTFSVARGTYPSESLSVDPRRVTPNKADRERALKEHREVRAIYADPDPLPQWKGVFQRPLRSDITSGFGNRRLFNGQLTSYHSGVDFRAAIGTPVAAAAAGRVRLAKELFYAGKTVLIDHGAGVFTVYAHLSRLEVKAGQPAEQSRVIGFSGASGRVSGPHLHWGVKLNGQNVDPLQFIEVVASLIGR